MIGMIKTNTEGFGKETIDNITKDWTGGSYHVLRSKSVVSGGKPLIPIGYKYNGRRVFSFIVIEVTGNIKSGTPYLSKDPDKYCNFSICPVAFPLVM